MTRFLVTGGQGFIGRHLTNFLRVNEPEAEVISFGHEQDLTDPAVCFDMLRRIGPCDYIFHLADLSGNAQWSTAHSAEQFFCNSKMALNILEGVSRYQKTARLIGFSSLWSYPAGLTMAREQDYWSGPLHEPTQHYGLTKKLLGGGLQACKQQLQILGTILVLGSVYGPGDHSDHVIPSLVQRMKEKPKSLEVWGNGHQVRDFIYIDDQVRAIYMHRNYNGPLLNIAGGKAYSIREVVNELATVLQYRGIITYSAEQSSERDVRKLDMTLATSETGWPGKYETLSLHQGLTLTLRGA